MKTIIITDQEAELLKQLIQYGLEATIENRGELQKAISLFDMLTRAAESVSSLPDSTRDKLKEASDARDKAIDRIETDYNNLLSLAGKLSLSVETNN